MRYREAFAFNGEALACREIDAACNDCGLL